MPSTLLWIQNFNIYCKWINKQKFVDLLKKSDITRRASFNSETFFMTMRSKAKTTIEHTDIGFFHIPFLTL